MTGKLITFRHLVVAGILCLACASCSDDSDADNRLPDGKYPMMFSGSVDGLTATRATTSADGETSWEANDPVAISMDGGANHKEYKISNTTDGSMVPNGDGNTLYWQKSNETKTLAAWHPVSCTIGSSTGGSEVNITDQSSGFGTLENILHAPAKDYIYSSGGNVAFNFRHALAKVKVTLKKEEGKNDFTNDEISGATVRLMGYTAGALGYSGMTGSGGNGEISPKTETTTATTYTALLIPQQMRGQQFIKVTIGARDYYYTPAGDNDANLVAGKQYAYTITVKKAGLDVTVTGNGTAWTDTPIDTTPDTDFAFRITAPSEGVTIAAASGGILTNNGNGSYTLSGGNTVSIINDNGPRIGVKGLYDVAGDGTTYTLKSDLLVEYSLTDAQVGDFYCRADNGRGYLVPGDAVSIIDQYSCVGLVFYVGHHTDDNTDYSTTKIGQKQCHGYVMALTDVNTGSNDRLRWEYRNGDNKYDQQVGASTSDSDWNGYSNTQAIKQYVADNSDAWAITDFPAANGCLLYGTGQSLYDWQKGYAAPTNSSGWFLPSAGQLSYLYENHSDLAARIQALGSKLESSYIKWFSTSWYYWSSSELSSLSDYAYRVDFDYGYVGWRYKDYTYDVRAVSAF